jgi:hypothetical protein
MSIDIADINKVDLLYALWLRSTPASFFSFQGLPSPSFDRAAAEKAVTDYIDYFQGRCIKMDLSGNTTDPRLYDRDMGEGAAAAIVAKLRS